jgi:hypothetical protein
MLLKLDAFDLKIVYRPGRLNTAADFLSRLPDESVSLESTVAVCNVNFDRKFVPAVNRRQVIQDYHVLALQHMGIKKTYDALCQRFFWPGMARDVKLFIAECPVCNDYNTAAKPHVPILPIESQAPHDIINIDVVGPLPRSNRNRYIIVAIDHYSKYGFAEAMQRVNANSARDFLKRIVQKFGSWKSITMDNAKIFTGRVFSQFLRDWKIVPHEVSTRHPEANGAAERFVRTLRQLLRKNASTNTWSQALPKVMTAYNAAKHTATSVTPILKYSCQNLQSLGLTKITRYLSLQFDQLLV